MKYLDTVDNFEQFLKRDPNLMAGSIKLYVKIVKELVSRYGPQPSLENLQDFIIEKCQRRQPTVKYAVKYYLKHKWRDNLWDKLKEIKIKPKPSKRKKKYLTREQAMNILDSIRKQEHKLVAKIQYFTGARASEVISIQKNNVDHESTENRICVNIIGKGGEINPIYLDDGMWPEIQDYIVKNDSLYLFLNISEKLSEHILRTKIETYYKRYYDSIRNASSDIGIEIATHDWRRSFTKSIREQGADIVEVQKALRHKNMKTTTIYFEDEPEKVAKTMLKHQQAI